MKGPNGKYNCSCRAYYGSYALLRLENSHTPMNNLKQDRIWRRQDWYGTELKNKKLGIIGFGNIGSRLE